MRVVSAEEIEQLLTFPDLVGALREAFRVEITAPPRQHHAIARGAEPDATLLTMPAWTGPESQGEPFAGVKIVTVFPGNAVRGLASVLGSYLLMDGATGRPLAVIDGARLTLWRTAAASALAASYLARTTATRMLMVGAGALASYLVRAHASVRPIKEVAIWNRTRQRAEQLAIELGRFGLAARVSEDLEADAGGADLVSCATLASEPLVRGAWLRDGVHLDLVGAYKPTMREADDEAVRRARLYCDTRAGALHEAGDLAQPLAAGLIEAQDIAADLAELCRGTDPGRRHAEEITLFKSVGAAVEDLAAAMLIWRRLPG